MRADNRGEGGILALDGARAARLPRARAAAALLIALGLFGAALLYGDGMITPAISVLGAVEGLDVGDAGRSTPYVVPITIVDPDRALPASRRAARRASARSSGR